MGKNPPPLIKKNDAKNPGMGQSKKWPGSVGGKPPTISHSNPHQKKP